MLFSRYLGVPVENLIGTQDSVYFGSWKLIPMRLLTLSGCVTVSYPSTIIFPPVGLKTVAVVIIRVVFPAPFGLNRPKTSLSLIVQVTSFTASTFLKLFETPLKIYHP